MLTRRSVPTRAVPANAPVVEAEPEYRVYVGTMTENDLRTGACFAMVAAPSLPIAIRKVHSTTRHKARGHWRETDNPTLIRLALTRPLSVFITEGGFSPDPEVFTDSGYNAYAKFKLR